MHTDGCFGAREAQSLLEKCAPWVQELHLTVEACSPAGVRLRLPGNARILRLGNTVAGQALMACADTAIAMAIIGTYRKLTNITTVSQTIDFMRPVSAGDVIVNSSVARLGRGLIFAAASFTTPASETVLARATSVWARIP